jgi:hypothetical protein
VLCGVVCTAGSQGGIRHSSILKSTERGGTVQAQSALAGGLHSPETRMQANATRVADSHPMAPPAGDDENICRTDGDDEENHWADCAGVVSGRQSPLGSSTAIACRALLESEALRAALGIAGIEIVSFRGRQGSGRIGTSSALPSGANIPGIFR